MSDALSILAAAGQAPQTIGLRTDGRAFSFAQLAALTEHRLGRADLAPARTVPFALDGTATVDTVVTLYALLESRRPALLLHPKLTGAERGAALRAVERCADALPADAAAIVLTSGTTGEPRPAVLTRDALLASAAASAANLGWRDDDCWLLAMPIARVGGLSILTRCLIARRTVARPVHATCTGGPVTSSPNVGTPAGRLVVAAAAAWVLAGERMDWREWVGAALIVSATLLSGRVHRDE